MNLAVRHRNSSLILILILGLVATRPASGQTREITSSVISFPGEFARGVKTTFFSHSLSLHWTLAGLGVLAAYPFDKEIQEYSMEEGLLPEPVARLGDNWGGHWAASGILPGILLAETLRGSQLRDKIERLKFSGESLFTVSVATQLMKIAVGRERPNGHGFQSFPSGHTSLSFGMAEVLRSLYGNRIGACFYSLAAITGISRIHDNKHYLSDVVAGAGLGIGIVRGFYLVTLAEKTRESFEIEVSPREISLIIHFN